MSMENAMVLTDWLIDHGHKVRVGQLRGCNPHVETTKDGFKAFETFFAKEIDIKNGYSHTQRAHWKGVGVFNDLELEANELFSLIPTAPIR